MGGDKNGQCAFISIDQDWTDGIPIRYHAEVDDLLPLDLDPEYRLANQDFRRTPQWPRYPGGPKYVVHYHELGGERVNSVKIHVLRSSQKALEDETVAVMT